MVRLVEFSFWACEISSFRSERTFGASGLSWEIVILFVGKEVKVNQTR